MKWFYLLIQFFVAIAFFSCKTNYNNHKEINYKAIGDSLTKATFDTMSATLQREIGRSGFAGAVNFCHGDAEALTQYWGDVHTIVRRTALRVRNPRNTPDSLELAQLRRFQDLLNSGKVAEPELMNTNDGTVHYFKPIRLLPLCLGCHGHMGSEIESATLQVIREKYPTDQAVDFKAGDLRGMWHIAFISKKENK